MKRWKKYLITYLFIIFLSFCFISYTKEEETFPVFNENKQYDMYVLTYHNPLSFSKYQELFQNLNKDDYKILSFSLNHHYQDSIEYQINQIILSKGDYLSAIDEYLKSYKNILYEFDFYSDIDRINRNDFSITKITMYSNYEVYLYLTSHSFF